jgi:catechol 2,3-dioxygenase-like lactoylglutathione lyase family enzyme
MPPVLKGVLSGLAVALPAVFHGALAESGKKPEPVTRQAWQEAVVSVTDLERSARFFIDIGSYEQKWRGSLDTAEIASWGLPDSASGEALLLGPEGQDSGLVRLVRFDNAGPREPMRPGSRAWDTGCYYSLMVRMKEMDAVYRDALAMGWWSETPITDLQFGTSSLKVIVLRGPDGLQVQAYERLSPPLPAAIPPFERITRPFNAMQMVRDRGAAYHFYTQVLGFATFHHGAPYTAPTPTHMPLGIPLNLTTDVPYLASIVYPVPGEFGRMETIEIDGLDGRDFAERCHAPNLGILAVRFPVGAADTARSVLAARDARELGEMTSYPLAPYGAVRAFRLPTPDGALIEFYSPDD